MKRTVIILSAICLLIAMCLTTLCGCSTLRKWNKEHLYNWLLENGELVKGKELVYEESPEEGKTLALHYNTGYSNELFVTYTISDYDGYEVSVRLPLFIDDGEGATNAYISLVNSEDFERGLEYSHNPSEFTRKTPIEHIDTYGDTLSMADYPHEYYDDKVVVKIPEEDKPKHEELSKMNALCSDLAHEVLCTILDWLNESVCPKADMTLADFGYNKYE